MDDCIDKFFVAKQPIFEKINTLFHKHHVLLEDMADTLPEQERAIFIRRYGVHGMPRRLSLADISEEFKMSRGRVWSLLTQAQARLSEDTRYKAFFSALQTLKDQL